MTKFDLGLIDGDSWDAAALDAVEDHLNDTHQFGTDTERSNLLDMVPGTMFFDQLNGRQWLYDGFGWLVMSEQIRTYIPTITQGGSVAKTVSVARYSKANGWCRAIVGLTLSGAGTAGQVITISLPLNARGDQGIQGQFQLYDASAGTFHVGNIYTQGLLLGSLQIQGNGAAGIVAPTLAAGDIFWATFHYECSNRYGTS